MLFQYGSIVQGLATTTAATGTTVLTNTSKQIQVLSASGSNSQIYQLPDATTCVVGMSYEFYNNASGTLTVNNNSTTTLYTVNPGSSLIVKLVNNGTSAGTWDALSSGSTASSGSKNYLTAYTASTSSSTPNSGNGNFESGSTSGWSLAHSSLTSNFPSTVGSGGNAFSSAGGVHGGSAANANLSLSVVSSNQLAGSYSASYSSSTATTAGDMIISNAFFIDIEDQAKIMQFSIAYKAQTNPSNGNFSGTSSNSFAVAIYDVTNNAWIMPAGVYNLVQNSGVGLATGTFQTTSNSTQYQIALYNANASSGAITLYLDDFFVGPQIVQKGPAMSDWVAYTPTFVGFGTPTAVAIYSRRVGDSLEIQGNFTTGTNTGSTASMTLGYGGLNGGVTTDSTKLPATNELFGYMQQNTTATNQYTVLVAGGATTVTFGFMSGSQAGLTSLLGTSFNNTTIYSFSGKVPIAGWSSNSVMSQDTDTRVVAARMTGATATVTGSYSDVTWTTVVNDTAGAMGAINYTVPVTGYYNFTGGIYASATTIAAGNIFSIALINTTGSSTILESDIAYEGTNNTSQTVPFAFSSVLLSAGTQVKIQVKSSTTSPVITSSATYNHLEIFRTSGPAVVAASESVNARYYASSTSISGSDTTIVWTTKDFDTHNAMSSGTYTIPVTGKYQINSSLKLLATYVLNSIAQISIYKNGTAISTYDAQAGGAETGLVPIVSDIISCLAGDLITIRANSSGSGPSIVSSNLKNWFSISRVGN